MGGTMKVKKKLEVFTVPLEELLTWRTVDGWLRGEKTDSFVSGGWAHLLRDGEIKEVRLTHDDEILPDDDEIEFTICSPKVQPAELAELRAKAEKAVQAVFDRYRQHEIDSIEATKLAKTEVDSSGFKVFYIEAVRILTRHLGRLPRADEKITKVELTNDGVEFTMVRV